MSTIEKIGQRFIFGVNSNNIDIIIELIKNYYIGGVILYKNNYHSYEEMLEVIKTLKSANKGNKIPLFIAIDQENGKVNRLPSEIHPIKNINDVSKKGKDLVVEVANITADILRKTGINMDFAPVMDIDNGSQSKALYKRCFYGSPIDIGESSSLFVKTFKNKKVVAVGKHFPGHGATAIDSHFMIPYVYNYQEILDKHILPFKKNIKNGIDAIMVGHLVIRKLTKGWPASASDNFITEYIRNDYDNLIITDEVSMLSNKLVYRYDKYLEKVLISHNDIILAKLKALEKEYQLLRDILKYLIKIKKYVID